MAKKPTLPVFKNPIKDKQDIIKQYLQEKFFAIQLRQTKINNWIKNEEGYNGVTKKTLITRSNIHVPVLFEAVQNLSSALGSTPTFKYDTIPEGNQNAAEIMKHVVQEDLDACDWELIYEQSKIEQGIYGRTIYEVIPGNDRNRVELVDTLAYLTSPISINTKDAQYQGRQFIYKTLPELFEDMDKMEYDEEELIKLREQKVPQDIQVSTSTEMSARNLRMANLGLSNTTQYGSKVAEITEWWTYIHNKDKTERELYCLTVANDVYLLRCVKAIDLGLKRSPFISWGAYNRGITFWCPGIADIYRDPNLAIDLNVNQIVDNNTYKNFGMKFVASSSGLKQSSIVPRPLGITEITVAPGEKIGDKVFDMGVGDLSDTPLAIQTIKGFADSASGLTPNAPASKGKVSVTQQAQLNAQVSAKVAIMKRNATLAFEELTQLMADITKEFMTKPRTIKIFGYKNLDIENVTKKNFRKVKLVSKASPSEDSAQNKAVKQKAKIDLYTLFKNDPLIPGQLSLRRSVAKTFDIEPDEIESFFTKDDSGNPDMSQMTTPIPGATNGPQPQDKAPTDATALLSATGTAAAQQIPATIKP